mmetsp:Transcript_62243/g.166777  ORF Transcript_62243/g.166777 Transcript_62243/m.166777 type:complete len:232 (-) Transcript_62243:249-944(-)
MQSVCRDWSVEASAEWSFSTSPRSPSAVAKTSLTLAKWCLVSRRFLLALLTLCSSDCFSNAKLCVDSVSAFVASLRWDSALSSISFRTSTIAPSPLGDSSSSSIWVCMNADNLAFEAVSMEEASRSTVRAAVTRPMACLSSCIKPFAISRFMMLRARSSVSMVSANSASLSVQSECCDLRTWDACSKSDSASAISLLRSSMVLSSTSMSELAFSTVAFKSSLRPAEFVNSC